MQLLVGVGEDGGCVGGLLLLCKKCWVTGPQVWQRAGIISFCPFPATALEVEEKTISYAATNVVCFSPLAARETATPAVTMACMSASTSLIVKMRMVLCRRRIGGSYASSGGEV